MLFDGKLKVKKYWLKQNRGLFVLNSPYKLSNDTD